MIQTQRWPADRALLFVHGVGNAKPGDYQPLVDEVQTILGAAASKFAIYFLYYDAINDWIATKLQAARQIGTLVSVVRGKLDGTILGGAAGSRIDPTALGNAISDFAGDVLWPVLIADARQAVRAALVGQLQQIVADGMDAGLPPRKQHISIIAHSLGCFHVYEALHAAAADPTSGLAPATSGVVFDNVIFMASPVQLIRTIADGMGGAVPQLGTLHSASSPLGMPEERAIGGETVASSRHTIAITGNLDPVGGFFLRSRADWAYMNLPGQDPFIDQEQLAQVDGSDAPTLATVLQAALHDGGPPKITPDNPHDWSAYISRHADNLRQWLGVA